jgi:hypothetical protein
MPQTPGLGRRPFVVFYGSLCFISSRAHSVTILVFRQGTEILGLLYARNCLFSPLFFREKRNDRTNRSHVSRSVSDRSRAACVNGE